MWYLLHMLGAISFFTLLPLKLVLSRYKSVFIFIFKLITGELFLAVGSTVPSLCPTSHPKPVLLYNTSSVSASQGLCYHTKPFSLYTVLVPHKLEVQLISHR